MYSDQKETPKRQRDRPKDNERFLDQGDTQGMRRRAYERKSRIFKRNKERREPTPEQRIIRILLDLSNKSPQHFQQQLESTVHRLKTFLESHNHLIQENLMDCAIELTTKTTDYAALTRALSVEAGNTWLSEFVTKMKDSFCSALLKSDLLRSRMLLRFYLALVSARVISPLACYALLDQIVQSALKILQSMEDKSGRTWQPYTDNLMCTMLLALPWGAADLFAEATADWTALSEQIEKYVNCRPIQTNNATKPFLAAIKEGDSAAQSDSGSAGFLNELWAAIKDLQANNQWQCKSVPTVMITQNDQNLELPLADLGEFHLPDTPPGVEQEMSYVDKTAVLSARYPPRGGVPLLEAEQTHPDALEIDRIVVEEYILDTLIVYHASRVDCVQRLTRGIPSPFPIYPLVAQTLFSQLLLLPKPPLQPVTYTAVIINLCKVSDEPWSVFPRGLSGCVREVFARMSVLDPELGDRMVDWLSLHLSNLGFMWPWNKWKKVTTAPEHDAQRIFVKRVLTGLVNLSYHGNVQEHVSPAEFHALLPPEAMAKTFEELFGSVQRADNEKGDDQMEIDEGEQQQQATNKHKDVSKLQHLQQLIAEKRPAQTILETFEKELSTTTEESVNFAKGVCRLLFVSGDKNLTHTENIVSRYHLVLTKLTEVLGESHHAAIVDAVTDVWNRSLHRACLVLTILMRKDILPINAILDWAFLQLSLEKNQANVSSAALLQVVKCALLYTESLIKEAEKMKSDAVVGVQHAKERAHDAAKSATLAAESVESGRAESVQEMIDAINEANAAEERARADVAEAEQHLRHTNEDTVNSAADAFKKAFLKVFDHCVRLLNRHESAIAKDSLGTEIESVHFHRLLSELGSLCRMHFAKIAPFVQELELSAVVEEATETVKKVIRLHLRIDKDDAPSTPIFDAKRLNAKRRESTVGSSGRISDAADV